MSCTKSNWQIEQYAVQRQYCCKICGLLAHSKSEIVEHVGKTHSDKEIENGELDEEKTGENK